MSDLKDDDLVDYDDAAVEEQAPAKAEQKDGKKGSFAAIHTSGFRDFLLKPELLQAIADCGFEHPSEVQQECIPQAILGLDVICQAKSGMGKTAVFVIAVLHQLEAQDGVIDSLVMCHTRELAYQICQEFERFSKYMQGVKVAVVYGGIPIDQNVTLLKEEKPHIVVGTPGRVNQLLVQSKEEEKKGKPGFFKLDNLKRFVLDECDKMLETVDMRRDIQNIFKATPHEKQVMMFSATMSKEARTVARKFAQQPMEIFVDDESKLTLHGLRQHYVKLTEKDKNRKLNDILDALDFNQVVIFVNSVPRAIELNKVLLQSQFPSMCIHSRLKQEERIERYNNFKNYKSRILVCTDIFGRGVDIERVNIVVNYDMPQSTKKGEVADDTAVQTSCDTYLHRVGRAGRFGTKGLAISFISSPEDNKVLEAVQARFEVEITALPDSIESSTYMSA